MSDINKIYKEWCGNSKHENDCHPVHDSTETIEFAEYYHNEIKDKQIEQLRERIIYLENKIHSLYVDKLGVRPFTQNEIDRLNIKGPV